MDGVNTTVKENEIDINEFLSATKPVREDFGIDIEEPAEEPQLEDLELASAQLQALSADMEAVRYEVKLKPYVLVTNDGNIEAVLLKKGSPIEAHRMVLERGYTRVAPWTTKLRTKMDKMEAILYVPTEQMEIVRDAKNGYFIGDDSDTQQAYSYYTH